MIYYSKFVFEQYRPPIEQLSSRFTYNYNDLYLFYSQKYTLDKFQVKKFNKRIKKILKIYQKIIIYINIIYYFNVFISITSYHTQYTLENQ